MFTSYGGRQRLNSCVSQWCCDNVRSTNLYLDHGYVNNIFCLKQWVWINKELNSRNWGRDRSVGIATCYGLDGPGIESRWGGEIFRTRPDRPWGLPSLLYSRYRVFHGGKAAGAWCWLTTPSSAEVKGYSYTSTPPLRLRGLL